MYLELNFFVIVINYMILLLLLQLMKSMYSVFDNRINIEGSIQLKVQNDLK